MYRFYPTIPILCTLLFPDCRLFVEFREPKIDGDVATCNDGTTNPQLAVETDIDFEQSDCKQGIPEMTNPSPNTMIEFPIYAVDDGKYDNDVVVNFVLTSIQDHPHHPIWQNYKFPTAQVIKIIVLLHTKQ